MRDYLEERLVFAALSVRRAPKPPRTLTGWRMALCRALQIRGLAYRCDVPVSGSEHGDPVEVVLDLVVEGALVVELKNLPRLEAIHDQQMFCFLGLSGYCRGMIINFGQAEPRKGIRRFRREGRKTGSRRTGRVASTEGSC